MTESNSEFISQWQKNFLLSDYDPPHCLPIEMFTKVHFEASNDDMKDGVEQENGVIVQVDMDKKFVLIEWECDGEKNSWTKRYNLPLGPEFRLIYG